MNGHYKASFPALGTTAEIIVTDGDAGPGAERVLRSHLQAIDLAASRFRDDSEITALNRSAGEPRPVSALLMSALQAAIRAAGITDGLVDPTVGTAMQLIGYDRDFAEIDPDGPALTLSVRRVPGWKAIELDTETATVKVPAEVEIDLGATAKALCADMAAAEAAREAGCGVLVSLGGDIAVGGRAPEGGWAVRIADDHRAPLDSAGPVVAIHAGGLATSSTSVRRWIRGGSTFHHLVDPATGLPAPEYWRTVSVAAGSCLDANIASCAGILLAEEAVAWLEERGLPARLVSSAGEVVATRGWPREEALCSP